MAKRGSCARPLFPPSALRTSRSLATLNPTVGLGVAPLVPCSLQQRRRRLALPGGLHRRLQKPPHRTARLRAGRQHRPDPLTPPLPRLTSRALRDMAVDHHQADRLLRHVVRRLNPWSGREPEITLPMTRRPFRQPRRGRRRRHVLSPYLPLCVPKTSSAGRIRRQKRSSALGASRRQTRGR